MRAPSCSAISDRSKFLQFSVLLLFMFAAIPAWRIGAASPLAAQASRAAQDPGDPYQTKVWSGWMPAANSNGLDYRYTTEKSKTTETIIQFRSTGSKQDVDVTIDIEGESSMNRREVLDAGQTGREESLLLDPYHHHNVTRVVVTKSR